jgi:RecJ-like exonuclease
MEESRPTLEYVSQITELNEMCDFLNDPVVDKSMEIIVKLYMKDGSVDPTAVPKLVIKLQAYAAHCALQAKYYTVFKKDMQRKNVYYTLEDALDKVVQALKYTVRFGSGS